jgi:hypothetical protein
MLLMKNIYSALAAAQTDMAPLIKGAVNPHFKSKYADLADLVEVVRPALNKHGIAFFHSMNVDGPLHLMGTILVHGETDTRIECWVPLIVAKNDMQGMKSATTYAKRIGLESVTGVAPEDDDGNAAAKAAPSNRADPRPDTSKVPPADIAKYCTAVKEIMDQDVDEYEHAELLREIHKELTTQTELYVAVADKLAADKIVSKAEWRKYISLKRDAA